MEYYILEFKTNHPLKQIGLNYGVIDENKKPLGYFIELTYALKFKEMLN